MQPRKTSARLLLHNSILWFRRISAIKRLMLCIGIVSVLMLVSRSGSSSDRSGWSPIPFFGSGSGKVDSSGWKSPSRTQRRPLQVYSASTWRKRKERVKNAFKYAYAAYEESSFGHDELKPHTNSPIDNLNGWGLTIVDSLDTMMLMGLDEQVDRAMKFIKDLDFHKHHQEYVNFFETTIRYMGGLLGAYYLATNSNNEVYRDEYAPILLKKANELGEILIQDFDSDSGLPHLYFSVKTGEFKYSPMRGDVGLAEMASCQMEFKYLSHLTRTASYFLKSDKVMDIMEQTQGKTPRPTTKVDTVGKTIEALSFDPEDDDENDTGLWTSRFHVDDAKMYGSQISAGSMGDSAYEYLLKQYLLTQRSETRLLDMYFKAMNGIINNLLYLSTKRNLLYVTDVSGWGTPTGNMDHLSCYLPGVLALGAYLLDPDHSWPNTDRTIPSRIDKRVPFSFEHKSGLKATLDTHMRAAIGLGYTCWIMYDDSETGIGPENVHFHSPDIMAGEARPPTKLAYESRKWAPKLKEWERRGRAGPLIGTEDWPKKIPQAPEYTARNSNYLLRPEAIEAMYLLWKTTGDQMWRERGWRMFEAVDNYCKWKTGYTTLQRVTMANPANLNEMPSFFLAETLKYAYLLTVDEHENPLPLDRMVFNTEAHPLPMFHWTDEEKAQYGIRT